jgi:hypothetical protein
VLTFTSTRDSTPNAFQLYWVEENQVAVSLPTSSVRSKVNLLPMDVPASTSIYTIVFPLSSDHLITLIQFNVLRGGLENRRLLDLAQGMDSRHPGFESTDVHVNPRSLSCELAKLPPSLRPTLAQQTIPHPHWIDIIPHPVWRDNLIRAVGSFDADQLWSDTVGSLFEETGNDEAAQGVVLWEPPWHWDGWELSEAFVTEWAWALKGCEELLQATNKWREKRGEDRIVIEL